MMRRRYAPSYYLKEIQRKEVEKIEGEKILQREREREKGKKEMMTIIDRGMADISKILEENLLQIQNHYIEPKINIEEKECLIVKETHEEECEKKRDKTKESDEKKVEEKGEEKENEKEKEEKNVGSFGLLLH